AILIKNKKLYLWYQEDTYEENSISFSTWVSGHERVRTKQCQGKPRAASRTKPDHSSRSIGSDAGLPYSGRLQERGRIGSKRTFNRLQYIGIRSENQAYQPRVC